MSEKRMVRLEEKELPRLGDVEVIIASGLGKGRRYSMTPKTHTTCNGTGQVVEVRQNGNGAEGVPGVCGCVDRLVGRELGSGVGYQVRWLTPEQREERRRAGFGTELEAIRTEMAELSSKHEQAIAECEAGAATARGKVDEIAQGEQSVREYLEELRGTLETDLTRLQHAEKELKTARLAVEHGRRSVRDAEETLEHLGRIRASSLDTAVALEREAVRLRDRSGYVTRMAACRREVARLEAEIAAQTAASSGPAAETVAPAAEA